MGFFSRSSGRPVFSGEPDDLVGIGTQAFGGPLPHPPGFSGLPAGRLDSFAIAAMESANYPGSDTPAWRALQSRFLDELTAAAERGGDWAFVGAMCVAWNFVDDEHRQDPRYLAILERALDTLRRDGVAYPAVPPFALEHWYVRHGRDGIRPKGWPSALTDVPVPGPGEEPDVTDLPADEARRMVQNHAGDQSNVIYAERRDDATVVAVIDGVDVADGVRKRWEWPGVEAADYRSFLRELGERLVTPPYWTHDDLAPYIPCRSKSRDAMRTEAAEATS